MKFLFVFIIVFFANCDKDSNPEKELKYKPFKNKVSMAPAELIRSSQPVDILFAEDMVPKHLIGVELKENPFLFEPHISGSAKWVQGSLLRFTPSEYFPAGQILKLKVDGFKALGKKTRNDLKYDLKVAEQEVLSFSSDFEPVLGKKNKVILKVSMELAGATTSKKIEDALVLKGLKKSIKYSVLKKTKRVFEIHSEELQRLKVGQEYSFVLTEGFSVSGDSWQKTIQLPGVKIFKVLSQQDLSKASSKTKTYAFRFNDPLHHSMDLSGFVSISPNVNFETKIEGKYLKVMGAFSRGVEYQVTIAKGLPSALGTKMKQSYRKSFSFKNEKPDLQWLSKGVYLPSQNNFALQFKSINIKNINVEVIEVFSSNVGFFLQNNELTDRSHNPSNDRYFSSIYSDLNRVGKRVHKQKITIKGEQNLWTKTQLDLSTFLKTNKKSLYVVSLEFNKRDLMGNCVNDEDKLQDGFLFYEDDGYYTNPCKSQYYYWRGNLNKVLIRSDIGLTMKETDSHYEVLATHLGKAKPIASLELKNLSYQNQVLETQKTDKNGWAKFEKKGFSFLGKNEYGLALLKHSSERWELNEFDIGGVDAGSKGTNILFYTDRGVHRPGDSIFLSALVRMDRKLPPKDLPIHFVVKNSQGQKVVNRKINRNEHGHLFLPIATKLKDPTGYWNASIEIGNKKYHKSLSVEMVKPNRLKVKLKAKQDKIESKLISGDVNAKYLFGTPAKNARVEVKAQISAKGFSLQKNPEYSFVHPESKFSVRTENIFDGESNENGNISFSKSLKYDNSPALLEARIEAKVTEKGGSFTKTDRRITIVPYSSLVGVTHNMKWESAKVGEKYNVKYVVVDDNEKMQKNVPLRIDVYVNSHRWWWHYNSHDKKEFKQEKSTYRISRKEFTSTSSISEYNLKVEDYGEHLVEITNLKSGHKTGFFFYASQWGNQQKGDVKERNFLKLQTNQNTYSLDDSVSVSFDSPRAGMAMLTVEQGGKILKKEWKALDSGRTQFDFIATKEMLPNVYASVSMIQPLNENTNDVPMRLYGIKTIFVEDSESHLPIEWTIPKKIEPLQNFEVHLESKGDKDASFSIAIVDEGLLDLTKFKTPDPWKHYFKKINLSVTTRDNFDQILGKLYPDIDRYFSIGGDDMDEESAERAGNSKAKRFIPAVLFQKPTILKAREKKSLSFTMPNYVGSVRFMLVAASEDQYASKEKAVPVSQPLMILPTIPRVARPGDIFEIPVSVFAMEKDLGDVSISLANVGDLKVIGPKKQKLHFQEIGEQDIRFKVQASAKVGLDSITVIAKSKRFKASYNVALPLQSAHAYQTISTDTISKGSAITLPFQKWGLEGTNKAYLQLSKIPDLKLNRRVKELIRYPYGCLEQTTSSVFPQLFLNDLVELKSHQKNRIDQAIHASFERLKSFQMKKGGFSYWPRSSYSSSYSDWVSSYVGHFLVEAKKKGYHVPESLWNTWLKDAKNKAKKVNSKNHRYQSYRLFVLALAGEANIGAMNLLRENYLPKLDLLSKKLLAASYYLVDQKEVVLQINSSNHVATSNYREHGRTYGSTFRDQALLAYLATVTKEENESARLISKLGKEYRKGYWFSTQESSMALLAFGKYFPEHVSGGDVSFEMNTGKQSLTSTLKKQMIKIPLDALEGELKVQGEDGKSLFISLVQEGIPIEVKDTTFAKNLSLNRTFYNENGFEIKVDELSQGEEFWVVYEISSVTGESLQNLALSSLFPSGWEIINPRMSQELQPAWLRNLKLSRATYVDVRDDRVNWFFNLSRSYAKRFAVKINPTFKGKYILPAVVTETMYSPDYKSVLAGSVVEVR